MDQRIMAASAVVAGVVVAALSVPASAQGGVSQGVAAGAAASAPGAAGAAAAVIGAAPGAPGAAAPGAGSHQVPLRAAVLETLSLPEWKDPAAAARILAQEAPAGYSRQTLAVLRRGVAFHPRSEAWQAAHAGLGAVASRAVLDLREAVLEAAKRDPAVAADLSWLGSFAVQRVDREAARTALHDAMAQAKALMAGLALERLEAIDGTPTRPPVGGGAEAEAPGGREKRTSGTQPGWELEPVSPRDPAERSRDRDRQPPAPSSPPGEAPAEDKPSLLDFTFLAVAGTEIAAMLAVPAILQPGPATIGVALSSLVWALGWVGLQAGAFRFGWKDPRTAAATLWGAQGGLAAALLLAALTPIALIPLAWIKALAIAGPLAAGLLQAALPDRFGPVRPGMAGRFFSNPLSYFLAAVAAAVAVFGGPWGIALHAAGLMLLASSALARRPSRDLWGAGVVLYAVSLLSLLGIG